ncbi:MAG TPA: hypothetical protein VNC78_01955 [Actinomycetota bacterium]|nr:hypothetical protein [Actinomycetota bacterium]
MHSAQVDPRKRTLLDIDSGPSVDQRVSKLHSIVLAVVIYNQPARDGERKGHQRLVGIYLGPADEQPGSRFLDDVLHEGTGNTLRKEPALEALCDVGPDGLEGQGRAGGVFDNGVHAAFFWLSRQSPAQSRRPVLAAAWSLIG